MNSVHPVGGNTAHLTTLGLLTKYWEPGQVKTRLARDIGMLAASKLHQNFVLYLCQSLATVSDRREICLAPFTRAQCVRSALETERLAGAWEIAPQDSGDLGRRMARWFEKSLATPLVSNAVLIGSDCPLISPQMINQASRSLESSDAVVGPAKDGGYYLIGFNNSLPSNVRQSVFENISWSTENVLDQTRLRLRELGLKWNELETMEDIDTISELDRFCSELAASSTTGESQTSDQARRQKLLSEIQSILLT